MPEIRLPRFGRPRALFVERVPAPTGWRVRCSHCGWIWHGERGDEADRIAKAHLEGELKAHG